MEECVGCVCVCVLALVSRSMNNCLFSSIVQLFVCFVCSEFLAEGSKFEKPADHSLVEVAVLFLTNSNWGLKS